MNNNVSDDITLSSSIGRQEMTFIELMRILVSLKNLFSIISLITFFSIVLYYYISSPEPLYRSKIVLSAPTLSDLEGTEFSVSRVSSMIENTYYSNSLRVRFFDKYLKNKFTEGNEFIVEENLFENKFIERIDFNRLGDDFGFSFESPDRKLSEDALKEFVKMITDEVNTNIINWATQRKDQKIKILKNKINQQNYKSLDREVELDSIKSNYEKLKLSNSSYSNISSVHSTKYFNSSTLPFNIALFKTVILTALISSIIAGVAACLISDFFRHFAKRQLVN
jgi:hypothetical protein